MNVVPFDPAPLVRGGFRAAPAGFAADAAYNLARQYGPRLANYALRNFGRLGMRAAREAWRRWGPRPQTFMDRARLALGRAQRTAVRRHVDRLARRVPRVNVKSDGFSQYRGARGTVSARRRGTQGMRRGGRYLPRVRTGGRRIAPYGPRPELKAYDKGATGATLSSNITYIIEPFNDILIGTNSNNRIGRKIRTKSLLLVGSIRTINVTSITTASDTVWIWVVLDTQPNATAAVATDVWSNIVAHTALKNLDQGGRFKILKCVEVKMDYGQTGTTVNAPFEIYMPLRLTPCWKGLVGSPPYLNNVLVFAGNSNTAMSDFLIDIQCRTRYYDN